MSFLPTDKFFFVERQVIVYGVFIATFKHAGSAERMQFVAVTSSALPTVPGFAVIHLIHDAKGSICFTVGIF
ncbi:MAG: hypothetical protein HOO93_17260 [Methyloglobulus sp.]|nr:hypothetical protein [Methyloglobulus sp.]